MPEINKEKDLSYYITLFKVEGHSTWRTHLGIGKDSFYLQWSSGNEEKGGKKPRITERRTIKVDRITGELTENPQ